MEMSLIRGPEKFSHLEQKKMMHRIALNFLYVGLSKETKSSEGRNKKKAKFQKGKQTLKLACILRETTSPWWAYSVNFAENRSRPCSR